MGPPLQRTREAWLNYVAQRMAPMFERLGSPLPTQLRIAIEFTSSGRRSKHIGDAGIISAVRIGISRFLSGPT